MKPIPSLPRLIFASCWLPLPLYVGLIATNYDEKVLMWQTLIHITFLLSVLAIALTDKISHAQPASSH
jgi:uncharacterized membrane protein YqhA